MGPPRTSDGGRATVVDTTGMTMEQLHEAVARGAAARLRALADALERGGAEAALLERARGDLDALVLLAAAAR